MDGFDECVHFTDTAVRDVKSGRVAVLRALLLFCQPAVRRRLSTQHVRATSTATVQCRHDGQFYAGVADDDERAQQRPVDRHAGQSYLHVVSILSSAK